MEKYVSLSIIIIWWHNHSMPHWAVRAQRVANLTGCIEVQKYIVHHYIAKIQQ